MLPKEIAKLVPKNHLMTEEEWRGIGVQQSQGWQHYMMHGPGKHNYFSEMWWSSYGCWHWMCLSS
jgi:hypothetical protein